MIRLRWELLPLDFWFALFYTICNMCASHGHYQWQSFRFAWTLHLTLEKPLLKHFSTFASVHVSVHYSQNLWMDFSTSFSYCMCVDCAYGTESGLLSIHIIKLNYFYGLHAETCPTNYMILWFSPLPILSNIIKCLEACAEHTQISLSAIVVSWHFSQLKI